MLRFALTAGRASRRVVVVLATSAALVACVPPDPLPAHCDNALDCALTEACRAGVCTPMEGEGEGEGEGELSDAEAMRAACDLLTACGQSVDPVDTCVADGLAFLQQLRSVPTVVCADAADAVVAAEACIGTLSCDAINSDPLSPCPIIDEATDLVNACQSQGGEGEGEGEGETCPALGALEVLPKSSTIALEAAQLDLVDDLGCAGATLGLTLFVAGDVDAAAAVDVVIAPGPVTLTLKPAVVDAGALFTTFCDDGLEIVDVTTRVVDVDGGASDAVCALKNF